MKDRILVVTRGDDAGSGRDANRAIAECCDAGMLRNVSVMAPGPALDAAAQMLAQRPQVCCGLHVTLNSEWLAVKWGPVLPAAEVPSLVDERGYFWPTPEIARDRGARVDEMLREIEAQLAAARRAGINLSYIDEHMGVSWPWPDLRKGIVAIAEREGLIDGCAVPGFPAPAAPCSDRFEWWENGLREAPAGRYLTANHPGFAGGEMEEYCLEGMPRGQTARERDGDRLFWLDPRVPELFRTAGARAVTYAER